MNKHGDIRFITATDPDDARRTVETLIEQKRPLVRAQGNPGSVCAAGTPRIFSQSRDQSGDAATRAYQPHRSRRRKRGDKSRPRHRRLLLPRAGELHRQRALHFRPGQSAPARNDGVRHRPRPQAFRLHHRRRTLQARMVRHRHATLRLHRARHLGRRAGGADVGAVPPHQALHQTNALAVAARGKRPLPPRLGVGCRIAGALSSPKSTADAAKPHKDAEPKRDRTGP